MQPVFRFAPSPNGFLHLGHAYSALLNAKLARDLGGRFLLRIEDIDPARSNADNEAAILDDLDWLGITWDEPPRRQSEHLDTYRAALDALSADGLIYPAFLSRGEVKAQVRAMEAQGNAWPRDPDGTPVFPDDDRNRPAAEADALIAAGRQHALRLATARALDRMASPLTFVETGEGTERTVEAHPGDWGDVILWRPDAPSSYHLSVVVDDALQGVTHVVRGMDLFRSTDIHRLLQALLGLPVPVYHHHRLILGPDGRKLSKSLGSESLAELRAAGASPADIRALVGL